MKIRDIIDIDKIISGRKFYQIETYGIYNVIIKILYRIKEIELKEIALIPGFLINIMLLNLLNKGGIYWNSRKPNRLKRDHNTFANLEFIEGYWII